MVSLEFITSFSFVNRKLMKILMESTKNRAIKYSLDPVRTSRTILVHCVFCMYFIRMLYNCIHFCDNNKINNFKALPTKLFAISQI